MGLTPWVDPGQASSPQENSGQASPLISKLQERGIRVIPVHGLARDIHILSEFGACWALLQLYRREKPDIIHLSSSKAGGIGAFAAAAYKIALRRRALVVFTVHGWPFGEDRPWWQRAIIFLACWASALLADRIILIDTADYRIARRFIPEKKLALIFHGIEPIPFLPRSDARAFLGDRVGLPTTADTLLVGANAELTKNKGFTYLIDAVNQVKSQIPNSKFQMLVMGEGEERGPLEEKIRKLNLDGTIFLIGFVPDAQRYLRAFDLFILPSIKEGLPYALLEAAAASLPIIASRVGGVPDIIHDNETGLLVSPKNPSALADAMEKLLTDRMFATGLGSHARDTASRSFRIDAMIANTRSLYGAHF